MYEQTAVTAVKCTGVKLSVACSFQQVVTWFAETVVRFLPKIFQAFLMSATLSEDVMSLKKLILRNPVSFTLFY